MVETRPPEMLPRSTHKSCLVARDPIVIVLSYVFAHSWDLDLASADVAAIGFGI
jgi:hypothetical protein